MSYMTKIWQNECFCYWFKIWVTLLLTIQSLNTINNIICRNILDDRIMYNKIFTGIQYLHNKLFVEDKLFIYPVNLLFSIIYFKYFKAMLFAFFFFFYTKKMPFTFFSLTYISMMRRSHTLWFIRLYLCRIIEQWTSRFV